MIYCRLFYKLFWQTFPYLTFIDGLQQINIDNLRARPYAWLLLWKVPSISFSIMVYMHIARWGSAGHRDVLPVSGEWNMTCPVSRFHRATPCRSNEFRQRASVDHWWIVPVTKAYEVTTSPMISYDGYARRVTGRQMYCISPRWDERLPSKASLCWLMGCCSRQQLTPAIEPASRSKQILQSPARSDMRFRTQ